jgi:hypothetical protein
MVNQENVYTCDKCGATFRDVDALVKHQQVHSGSVEEKKELETGTQPPMEDSRLPPGGNIPIHSATGNV